LVTLIIGATAAAIENAARRQPSTTPPQNTIRQR
jgi:hypothetical protein